MRIMIISACLFLVACSNRLVQTELYFGQSKPNGELISEAEWNEFKKNYVTNVFREGCSVHHIKGMWKDAVSK
ncbi:MAG: hypothetical protein C4308_07575 [Chitinophagaceae bacterium]|mgnify:CR=1 FL=1